MIGCARKLVWAKVQIRFQDIWKYYPPWFEEQLSSEFSAIKTVSVMQFCLVWCWILLYFIKMARMSIIIIIFFYLARCPLDLWRWVPEWIRTKRGDDDVVTFYRRSPTCLSIGWLSTISSYSYHYWQHLERIEEHSDPGHPHNCGSCTNSVRHQTL